MTEVQRYAAFTRGGEGGNPAGVVLDASGLADADMLRISAELGYSESAFLVPGQGRRSVLRFFSPLAEVAFCGHATIATAVALARRDGPGDLVFETPAGDVAVTTTDDGGAVTAALTSPPVSSRPATDAEIDALLAAFRWGRDALDGRYPVHVGFAGNHHPLVGVRDRATLADFDYDYDALARLMRDEGWTTVHVFTRTGPASFAVRNAFPPGGVREDPATGAAASAFGGYLRDRGELPGDGEIELTQGEDMGAPSLLFVSDAGGGSIRVRGAGTRLPD